MSEGNIEVTMTLKEAKFITGLLNASRAQDKLDDGFIKIARDAAKAEADIKRFADQTTKINVTPLEAYDATVVKLDASLKKGLITQETYTRAIERAKKEKDDADGTTKRLADDEAKMAKAAQEAANALKREADEVQRFAAEVTRINSTPMEAYSQKVEKLDAALRSGAISQEIHTRAVERSRKEMEDADGTTKRLADQEAKVEKEAKEAANALKREADELKRFSDETRRVNSTPIERYKDQVARLKTALDAGTISQDTYTRAVDRAKKELVEATNASREAAGPSILSGIAGLAATWISVQGAVQLVGQALEHAKQESIATVESVKQLSNVNRNLNQISGTPQELAELQKRADKVAATSGLNREAARDALTMANNEGWGKDFEKIASSWQSLDTKSASIVAGQVPGMFGGKINSLESVNLTLAAARESRLDPADFAHAMPTAAEGAVPAGTSPEQLFALMAALSVKYSSASTGADRLRGFGSKLSMNKEFEGKSYIEAAEMMSKDETLREKVLGKDMETNNTMKFLLSRKDEVSRLEAMLKEERSRSGTAASSLEIANANALANPELRSEREIAISKNKMEIERQSRLLEKGTADEIATNKVKELLYKNNVSSSGVYVGEKAAGLSRFVGLPDYMTEAIGLGFGTMGDMNTIGPEAKARKLQSIRRSYLSEADELNGRRLGPITPDELQANSKRSADAMERVEKLMQEQNEILKQSKTTQTENSRNQTRTSAALPSLVK